MKKQVTILSSLGVLFIVLGIITNFTINLKQDKKEVNIRMKSINSIYEIFKTNTQSFSETRDHLYDNIFSELYFETLNQSIPRCLEELQNYEVILNKVVNNAIELKKKCEGLYFPEANINTKCKTAILSYEEMVNYFINDVTQVNENIEEFNKYNKENNTGIAPLQKYNTTKKYIDFNNDKDYTGKEDF